MADIHPAVRAEVDRELPGAIAALLGKAAEHDDKDLVEANLDLANWLLAHLGPTRLAAAAAALALHLHRQPGGGHRG